MSTLKSTDLSNVYIGFKEIPEKDFFKQIYYIEKHLNYILDMHYFYKIELLFQYVNALFEIGHYKKCLAHIDDLIYDVFDALDFDNERSVICDLLIKKSCALFNVGEYEKAEHVTKELLKLDPENKRSLKILQSIKLRLLRHKFSGLRALSIILLFFGLCITCFDLLVIQTFHPEKALSVMILRNIVLGASSLSLLGLELSAIILSKNKSKQFQYAIVDKKLN